MNDYYEFLSGVGVGLMVGGAVVAMIGASLCGYIADQLEQVQRERDSFMLSARYFSRCYFEMKFPHLYQLDTVGGEAGAGTDGSTGGEGNACIAAMPLNPASVAPEQAAQSQEPTAAAPEAPTSHLSLLPQAMPYMGKRAGRA